MSPKTVFITEGESAGFYMARACLTSRKFEEVIVGCKDQTSELCKALKSEGAKVVEWDVMSKHSIRQCLRGVDCMVLIPEPHFRAVESTRNILEVLESDDDKEVDVESLVFWSCAFTEAEKEFPKPHHKNVVRMFCEMERMITKCRGVEQWTICRMGMLMQTLFMLSEMIQSRGIIPIAVGDAEFAPVNLKDCAHATLGLLCTDMLTVQPTKKSGAPKFHKATLTFNGPQMLTGKKLADKANKALNTTSIRYEPVDTEEMRSILEKTAGDELSKCEIEMALMMMECVEDELLDMECHDLTKLLGMMDTEPTTIETFFAENADMFKPRGGRVARCMMADY